jgi:hypothetical protein
MKIEEGQRVPFFYGYAWRNYDSKTTEVYLIPINYILRFLKFVWIKGMQHEVSEADIAFEKGYELGKKDMERRYKYKFTEAGMNIIENIYKNK